MTFEGLLVATEFPVAIPLHSAAFFSKERGRLKTVSERLRCSWPTVAVMSPRLSAEFGF